MRGTSAQRYPGKLPLGMLFFIVNFIINMYLVESLPIYPHHVSQSPSVNPVRTPGNQWQCVGNLYDRQIANEQEEFARYRSESGTTYIVYD